MTKAFLGPFARVHFSVVKSEDPTMTQGQTAGRGSLFWWLFQKISVTWYNELSSNTLAELRPIHIFIESSQSSAPTGLTYTRDVIASDATPHFT
jgi:hypothetical protein